MPAWTQPIATYRQTVRASLASRREIAASKLGRIVLPVAIGLALTIAFSLLIAPAGDRDFHFREEDGIVTTLSAIFLAMASGFAGATFLTERGRDHGLRVWWLLTCLGFLFFACDELLRFHEQLGTYVRAHLLGRPTHVFRNWNDVIVIAYGVVALVVLLQFLPRVLRLPLYPELLALGFGAYVVHTGVDTLPHPTEGFFTILNELPTGIVEESAKLCASTFFAVAMLNGLLIVVRQPPPAKPETPERPETAR